MPFISAHISSAVTFWATISSALKEELYNSLTFFFVLFVALCWENAVFAPVRFFVGNKTKRKHDNQYRYQVRNSLLQGFPAPSVQLS